MAGSVPVECCCRSWVRLEHLREKLFAVVVVEGLEEVRSAGGAS
jgi:hypothetical protein